MNKADLIARISTRLGGDKKAAEAALDAVTGTIIDSVKGGEDVAIPGFGKFAPKNRPERAGRNVRTGEAITIAASKNCSFSPAKGFKDALNG